MTAFDNSQSMAPRNQSQLFTLALHGAGDQFFDEYQRHE